MPLKKTWISRLPNYLIIQITRYRFSPTGGRNVKLHTKVNYPLTEMDMTPYFIPTDGFPTPSRLDRGLQGPFKYDCYGVVQHLGDTVNSGHYWANVNHFVNGKPSPQWYEINDTAVTKSDVRKVNPSLAYLLFYKRQGRA
jgi:ubiquitin carboxyl-terminal hydrolase 8